MSDNMAVLRSGITVSAQLSMNGGARWPDGFLASAAVAAGFRLRSAQRGLKSYKRKVPFVSSESAAVPPVGRKPFLLVRIGNVDFS